MAADLPFLNSFFGSIFGSDADVTPYPYKVFYLNLNVGSTYFLALLTILFLLALSFLVQKAFKL